MGSCQAIICNHFFHIKLSLTWIRRTFTFLLLFDIAEQDFFHVTGRGFECAVAQFKSGVFRRSAVPKRFIQTVHLNKFRTDYHCLAGLQFSSMITPNFLTGFRTADRMYADPFEWIVVPGIVRGEFFSSSPSLAGFFLQPLEDHMVGCKAKRQLRAFP